VADDAVRHEKIQESMNTHSSIFVKDFEISSGELTFGPEILNNTQDRAHYYKGEVLGQAVTIKKLVSRDSDSQSKLRQHLQKQIALLMFVPLLVIVCLI